MIHLKRAYDQRGRGGGKRYLVDRIWPRGVKKEALRLDGWFKDVAPSTGLRKWFGHDEKKWEEFNHRYRKELESHPEALDELRTAAREGDVTLVYSAHDPEHNNAVALKEYLQGKAAHQRR